MFWPGIYFKRKNYKPIFLLIIVTITHNFLFVFLCNILSEEHVYLIIKSSIYLIVGNYNYVLNYYKI
jgi:hypothetical protein